ncbi:hypothetical protein AVEN_11880-1 [Araneus ventricosus]|uniref:Uncharacterized protein n=1 Tax=Araneus ventricosus TaxID=182803 RepID=A0A4Y2TA61_ARAVE|nr:hypothetical protein AVEN_11880-1 [Araneus ventricosus]
MAISEDPSSLKTHPQERVHLAIGNVTNTILYHFYTPRRSLTSYLLTFLVRVSLTVCNTLPGASVSPIYLIFLVRRLSTICVIFTVRLSNYVTSSLVRRLSNYISHLPVASVSPAISSSWCGVLQLYLLPGASVSPTMSHLPGEHLSNYMTSSGAERLQLYDIFLVRASLRLFLIFLM